jgi:dTDP-4-amino-4,6-dideoxygalactose transaminase
MEECAFVLGADVSEFEKQFARFCGVAEVVGVGNGTDAIELALRGLGVGSGDEVILPANTFVATAEAVWRAGATPVLVDCDEYFLIDADDVVAKLSSRTRAVIGVHLFGQAAFIERIRDVVPPGVLIVEDAAQAQGARRHGARAGSLGDAAATSFYPGKNLGAYGDAGAVMTNSQATAEAIRRLRNHGGVAKYEHELLGVNSRLDSIQAAVLLIKLRLLDSWNAERSTAAALYEELLGHRADIVLPVVAPGNEHVWHLYVVRVPERDRILQELIGLGIGAGIHYRCPVHRLPAFQHLGHRCEGFPRSERFAQEILSLPIFPGITPDQQVRVAESLTTVLDRR